MDTYEKPEIIVFSEDELNAIKAAAGSKCGPPFSQCGNRRHFDDGPD